MNDLRSRHLAGPGRGFESGGFLLPSTQHVLRIQRLIQREPFDEQAEQSRQADKSGQNLTYILKRFGVGLDVVLIGKSYSYSPIPLGV